MGSHRYAPLIIFQLILAVLFFLFTSYDKLLSHNVKGFEETHVMIFIGFAYLMTFLKKYCYSATGYNLFLAALVVQWNLICLVFLHKGDEETFHLSMQHLLEADIMSATVLITFGALLGLASGEQLLFIAIIEGAVGNINLYISEDIYKASDIGGSMGIHAYGAYFGLAVSAALRMKKVEMPATSSGMLSSIRGQKEEIRLDGPSYISDVTAMIGTLFLWVYWPCFNSALADTEVERQRAKINTYLSLASCTVVSFVMSAEVSHKPGKLDMVHIQNSTLAGGVAVGAVANFYIGPGVAVLIGMSAGVLSVLGYRYITPKMEKSGIQDTCGVNNLHGMPGIYSGLLSALFAYLATFETYGLELGTIFPACSNVKIHSLQEDEAPEIVFDARSMSTQAAYQLIALATTLGLGLVAGLIAGLISKAKIFSPLDVKQRYDDDVNWELP